MEAERKVAELEVSYTPMRLSYCERCGTLRVHAAADASPFCASCAQTLAWLGAEGRS